MVPRSNDWAAVRFRRLAFHSQRLRTPRKRCVWHLIVGVRVQLTNNQPTMINNVTITGRSVHDAQTHVLSGGTIKGTFRIATNDPSRKDKDGNPKVHYFNVECWGKVATNTLQWVGRGKSVVINGSLEYQSWTGKAGQNCSQVVIKATSIELIGQKRPVNDDNDNY